MQLSQILKDSIIVAAHPDDEVLWFSSLLEKVDEVLICFLSSESNSVWNIGRKKTLAQYPIKNVSCLGVDMAETLNATDWQNPVITKSGLKISRRSNSKKKYLENYFTLRELLRSKLRQYSTVFTHNPWGEYGHEEHVQVYRIVKELQEDIQFDLWFPNYCSNKSFKLMTRYVSTLNSQCVTLGTNKELSDTIINLYKKNGCWTWYNDWKYFGEETFIMDSIYDKENKKFGSLYPLNLIRVRLTGSLNKRNHILLKIKYYIVEKLIKNQI